MNLESTRVSIRRLGRQWQIARFLLIALWLIVPSVLCLAPPGALPENVTFCWGPLGLLTATGILLSMRSRAFLAGARRWGRAGSVAVVDDTLELHLGERVVRFPRAVLAAGWIEADRTVLMTEDGTEIAVALADSAQEHALLHAAGVAPEQRAVKLVVRPPEPWIARVFGFAFALVIVPAFVLSVFGTLAAVVLGPAGNGLPNAVGGAILSLVMGLMVLVLAQRLPSTALSIGADGLVVERLFRKRLLLRADLVEVVADGPQVVIRLRRGRPLTILASAEGALAVADRIREALAPTAAPAMSSAALGRLDRGGREVGDWLVDLRSLGREGFGYREAAVDASTLLELVKDGAAPAERRIAAAVVLAQRDEGAARSALRVAVDTCVDERVRGVMVRVAEGDVETEEVEAAVRRA